VKTKPAGDKVDKNVTFDFTAWKTMEDYWQYQDLANGNDRDAFLEYLAPHVVSWDYPHDPQDAESYRQLTFKQWNAFLEGLKNAVQDILKS
jgi:hypothetical protein